MISFGVDTIDDRLGRLDSLRACISQVVGRILDERQYVRNAHRVLSFTSLVSSPQLSNEITFRDNRLVRGVRVIISWQRLGGGIC